jgi:hypothetical protein
VAGAVGTLASQRPSEAPGPGSSSGVGSNGGIGPAIVAVRGPASNPDGTLRDSTGTTSGSASGAGALSSGTLGLAVMDVGGGPLRSRVFAVASASAGAVLGIAGLILLLTRHPAEHGDPLPDKAAAEPSPTSPTTSAADPLVSAGASWTAAPVAPAAPMQDSKATSAEAAVPAAALRPVSTATATGGVGPAPAFVPRPPLRPPAKPNHTKTRVDDGF